MPILRMHWSLKGQYMSRDDEEFRHEGEINSDPSHDFSHLVVAAHEDYSFEWRPSYEDSLRNAFGEYNAVFTEFMLNECFKCVQLRSYTSENVNNVIEHSKWFVNTHYSPFPVSDKDALLQLSKKIRTDVVTRLSPIYYLIRYNELKNWTTKSFRSQEYVFQFDSKYCPDQTPHSRRLNYYITKMIKDLKKNS